MTRPSLADITRRDALRVHLKGAGAPALMAEKNAASAADVPPLLAALRAVLDLHYEATCSRGAPQGFCVDCDQAWPCATVRAVTAHIDTTPKEKP